MTRQGNVIGTIEYMSPEQVKGLETDARSDIYSLGMLLYEMLTGRIPFDITNEFELMKAQIDLWPTPPRQINPGIPEAVEAAIGRAIAKDPAQRFQSAGEFRSFLLNAGFAATGRLDPVTHGEPSPYATRPIGQPPLSNPPAGAPSNPGMGYATVPSQPGLASQMGATQPGTPSSHTGTPPPSQPGVTSPSHPGVPTPPQPDLHTAPTVLTGQPSDTQAVDPMAQTIIDGPAVPTMPPPSAAPPPPPAAAAAAKETRIGAPGEFAAAAPAASREMKETRLGVSPLAGPAAARPASFSPTPPPPAAAKQSFFSRLTWVHYAGAGVAALVLAGVVVGGAAFFLFSGKNRTPQAPPAKALTDETVKPAAPEPTATTPPEQTPATAGGGTTLEGAGAPAPAPTQPVTLPPAQAQRPPGVTPVQPAPRQGQGQSQTAGSRPPTPRAAPPQAQKPKSSDDAAARRRRALEALDQ
jgi:hypothetical protein